jgi:hypothetical protein
MQNEGREVKRVEVVRLRLMVILTSIAFAVAEFRSIVVFNGYNRAVNKSFTYSRKPVSGDVTHFSSFFGFIWLQIEGL